MSSANFLVMVTIDEEPTKTKQYTEKLLNEIK